MNLAYLIFSSHKNLNLFTLIHTLTHNITITIIIITINLKATHKKFNIIFKI